MPLNDPLPAGGFSSRSATRDDGTVLAGILGDLPQWHLCGLAHDLDADALVVIFGIQLGEDR